MLEIIMICRRTGNGKSKSRVEPPGGCIHAKDAKREGLPINLCALDKLPKQNGTDTAPLKLWQEKDLCKEEFQRAILDDENSGPDVIDKDETVRWLDRTTPLNAGAERQRPMSRMPLRRMRASLFR